MREFFPPFLSIVASFGAMLPVAFTPWKASLVNVVLIKKHGALPVF